MGLRNALGRATVEAARLGTSAATDLVRLAAGFTDAEDVSVVPPPEHDVQDVERPGGASIRVRVSGEGPTVVLLHGYGLGAASWNGVATRLVDTGHRVVSFDWRAHGSSSCGDGAVTTDALIDDLVAVLEELEIEDAVLVGHSTGGYVAIATLVEQPEVQERLRGLVLVATLAGDLLEEAPDEDRGDLLRGSPLDRIVRNRTLHLLLSGFGGSLDVSPAVAREFLDEFADADHGALVSLVRELSERSYYGRLDAIELDTVVLCGDADRTTPPAHARAIADEIPGARQEWIADAQHLLTWQHPDEVARTIASMAGSRSGAPDGPTRRAVFILNPASGDHDADETEQSIVDVLARAGVETEVRRTEGEGDARAWAAEAAGDDVDVIMVGGGDGTVREAVSGLVDAGSSTTLGIVPLGTANLFARALDIPMDHPASAAAVAAGDGTRDVDVIARSGGDEHAVLMVDAGFDAELVRGASRSLKNVIGSLAYVVSGLRSTVGLREVDVTVTVDDEEHEVRAHSVLCVNVGRVGDVVIDGSIEPDDGQLHVGVVQRSGPVGVLWTATNMVLRGRDAHPNVTWFRGTRVQVRVDGDPLAVQVDGDLSGETPLDLELLPGAVTVAVP